MCNETPNTTVIAKIQKLLALGRRGGTEQEADAAMAKAQELLAKYNLDLAVVEDAKSAQGTTVDTEKREKTRISKSAMYQWQRDLCRQIAEANFCWYWTMDVQEERWGALRNVKRHVILGRESNVVAVQLMYEWLVETMEEILPYPQAERLSRSAVSWRLGFANRVGERIATQAYKLRHSTPEGTPAPMGLVTIEDVAKREYAANYDALHGEGAWAKYQARKAEWEAAAKNAVVTVDPAPVKPLTAKQQAAKDAQNAKYWERWQRAQDAKAAKIDHEAYYRGSKVGGEINLGGRLH